MTTIDIRGATLVLCEHRRKHPGCDGDELILRLVGPDRALVTYADRCGKEPDRGCDGQPWFMRGDLVKLPRGWRRNGWEHRTLMDLEIVPEVRRDPVSAARGYSRQF